MVRSALVSSDERVFLIHLNVRVYCTFNSQTLLGNINMALLCLRCTGFTVHPFDGIRIVNVKVDELILYVGMHMRACIFARVCYVTGCYAYWNFHLQYSETVDIRQDVM